MAYRHDTDLSFLSNVNSADMDGLVTIMTHDKDGDKRFTEELTTSAQYKQHFPDHAKYWELVAAELQSFGANSLITLLRGGKGVEYKEILCDVCDKLKVNYNKNASAALIEQNMMLKIIEQAVEKMTPDEVRQMAEEAGVTNFSLLSKEAALAAFLTVFRAGGFRSYQILVIVVNLTLKALIGRGLSFAVTGSMMRTASVLTGPIGWAVTGLWTAFDIASPAYRVTIPAVIQVAVLRQKVLMDATDKPTA
jgi:uncharacterized protein YaaW (UPF0174 family)